jgi:hypothetical protein
MYMNLQEYFIKMVIVRKLNKVFNLSNRKATIKVLVLVIQV